MYLFMLPILLISVHFIEKCTKTTSAKKKNNHKFFLLFFASHWEVFVHQPTTFSLAEVGPHRFFFSVGPSERDRILIGCSV